jgi:hypothetical protein
LTYKTLGSRIELTTQMEQDYSRQLIHITVKRYRIHARLLVLEGTASGTSGASKVAIPVNSIQLCEMRDRTLCIHTLYGVIEATFSGWRMKRIEEFERCLLSNLESRP